MATYASGVARGIAAKKQAAMLQIVRECLRQSELPEKDTDAEAEAAAA